jgi:uncharacterized protein (TIGR04255 family)
MNRTLPALYLEKCPLVLVLAQVRISSIQKMEDFIPEIQEKLRKTGFPRFKRLDIQELTLVPTPSVALAKRWIFSNKEENLAVVLHPDFVVLETASYQNFDTFIRCLDQVLQILSEVTQVQLVERLGLRYVNLIRPQFPDTFATYLNSGIVGIDAQEKMGIKHSLSRFESVNETPFGKLIIRLSQNDRRQFLPPDLVDHVLHYDLELSEKEVVALLDIDHFSETPREDFSVSRITEKMWNLHDYTDQAFRSAVTSTALERWGSKEVP